MSTVTYKLVSRLDNPVTVSYNSESMNIPPRGTIKKINPKLLGALPKGVSKIRETTK